MRFAWVWKREPRIPASAAAGPTLLEPSPGANAPVAGFINDTGLPSMSTDGGVNLGP